MNKLDLGAVTAYAMAVVQGYEGTEEEFAALQANSGNNALRAENAADRAQQILDSIPLDFQEVSQGVATLTEEMSSANNGKIRLALTTDFSIDDIKEPGYYMLSDSIAISGSMPSGMVYAPTYLIVEKMMVGTEWIKQTLGTVSVAGEIEYHRYRSNVKGWLAWRPATPFTTAQTRDITAELQAHLTAYGCLELGAGDFYISNLQMPANSTIRGQGKATCLHVTDENAHGIIVAQHCQIKDVHLIGPMNTAPSNLNATGCGIYIAPEEDVAIGNVIISGCEIQGFATAGIYAAHTGYSAYNSVSVTNCFITNCYYGLDIENYSEYGRYTNIIMHANYISCINRGGNNIFVNCTFGNATRVGFYMECSGDNGGNNGHGSCVGCSFNHVGSNAGYSILLNGVTNGFVFSGCQFWYGTMHIEGSSGIVFSGCQIRGGEATASITSSCKSIIFNTCMFFIMPVISLGSYTPKLVECYTIDGTAVTV